uniref:LRRCT domain-containing protein n=1 Tax=Panagrolaimus sp. PS1159 TaxID=55785 RepID=A0AC35FHH2_9BILA
MIPEDLWNNISKFALGRNQFYCNCSMAWLINDLLYPTHSVNLTDIAPRSYQYSWENPIVDYKCYGPYALKELPFTHISRNFCQNEATKKKYELKEKIITVLEPQSPFFVSWFHICIGISLTFFAFAVGISIVPFFRYLYRTKKQHIVGFSNQNFPDAIEDFDDEKISQYKV